MGPPFRPRVCGHLSGDHPPMLGRTRPVHLLLTPMTCRTLRESADTADGPPGGRRNIPGRGRMPAWEVAREQQSGRLPADSTRSPPPTIRRRRRVLPPQPPPPTPPPPSRTSPRLPST